MDKFYIKDEKIYVENEVELIELTLNELIEETNRLSKKDCMMELALEMACNDLSNDEDFITGDSKVADYKKQAYHSMMESGVFVGKRK